MELHRASAPDIPDIVQRAQRGDTRAFEQLYREHCGRVYAVCLRIAADRGRAEELTQDVFVRAWDSLTSFRGDSAFSSWLHRIAVNAVLVDLRTRKRYMARVESTDDLVRFDRTGNEFSWGEHLDLEKAIAALPPQARAIFILHDIEGYRHEEIAEQMELAVGTSKAQLHRARRLLREALKQ